MTPVLLKRETHDPCSTGVQYMYYMYMCRLHSSMLLPFIY